MVTIARLSTIDDLWNRRNDAGRFDLIDGELIEMSPAGGTHGEIVGLLAEQLVSHVRAHRLGKVFLNDTGFVVGRNPDAILCPDLAFVRKDQLPPNDELNGFVKLAPDLAVEIVSPFDSWSLVARKAARYFASGTTDVWVVDPATRSLEVHSATMPVARHSETDTVRTHLLPGFELDLHQVFPSE